MLGARHMAWVLDSQKNSDCGAVWGTIKRILCTFCWILLLFATAFADPANGNAYGKVPKDSDTPSASPLNFIFQYPATPTSTNFTKANGRGAVLKQQLA